MLGVVEDQQGAEPVAERVDDALDEILPRRFDHLEHITERSSDTLGVTPRRQLDPRDTTRVSIGHPPPELRCQPGLAAPARSRERDHVLDVERVGQLGQLHLPTDQRGDEDGRAATIGHVSSPEGQRDRRHDLVDLHSMQHSPTAARRHRPSG